MKFYYDHNALRAEPIETRLEFYNVICPPVRYDENDPFCVAKGKFFGWIAANYDLWFTIEPRQIELYLGSLLVGYDGRTYSQIEHKEYYEAKLKNVQGLIESECKNLERPTPEALLEVLEISRQIFSALYFFPPTLRKFLPSLLLDVRYFSTRVLDDAAVGLRLQLPDYTPVELARAEGKNDLAEILEYHIRPGPRTQKDQENLDKAIARQRQSAASEDSTIEMLRVLFRRS